MRLIDRLLIYLESKKITAYSFCRTCEVSRSYITQQLKGKGGVGSDILVKIKEKYPDVNLLWLVTGKGKMLIDISIPEPQQEHLAAAEEQAVYFSSKDEVIALLKKQIEVLQSFIADKDKIISLLESGHQ